MHMIAVIDDEGNKETKMMCDDCHAKYMKAQGYRLTTRDGHGMPVWVLKGGGR
jgi:hypothetical protein